MAERPGARARDVSRIYEELGGKASVGCAYARVDVEGVLSKLQQTGAIRVELVSHTTGEETARSTQLALAMFQDRIVQELFRSTASPALPRATCPGLRRPSRPRS